MAAEAENNSESQTQIRSQFEPTETQALSLSPSPSPSPINRTQSPVQSQHIPSDKSDVKPVSAVSNQPESTQEESTALLIPLPPPTYPREICKTIGVCILAAVCLFSNSLVLSIIHDLDGRRAMPDMIFSLVPQQQWAWRTADVLLYFCIAIPAVFCVLFHRHRFIILKRWAFLVAVAYALRAMCLSVTLLPAPFVPYVQCAPAHKTSAKNVFKRWFHQSIMLGVQDGENLCGDYMYSGHTIQMCMGWFVFSQYAHRSLWAIKPLLVIATIFGMICLAIARGHYTVDLIISYVICTGIFSIYHGLCDIPKDDRPLATSFRRLGLFWIMYDLEKNVPHGALPNQLSWPFPRPRRLVRAIDNWSHGNKDTCAGRVSAKLAALCVDATATNAKRHKAQTSHHL